MMSIKAIVLFLLISAAAVGQQMKMRIHLNDGSNDFYPIDDIDSITFVHHSSDSTYDMVKAFSNFVLHTDGRYESEFPAAGKTISDLLHGLMTFSGDTLDISRSPYSFERYPLVGLSPSWRFDSITFAQYTVNQNIARLYDSAQGSIETNCGSYNRNYSYHCISWHDSMITNNGTQGFGSLTINKQSVVIDNKAFCPHLYSGYWFEQDGNTNKFITSHSRFNDPIIQAGILIEYIVNGGEKKLLESIDSNISRAIYYRSDSIIYYSYGPSFTGSALGADAGFYLYEPAIDRRTFLLPFASDVGTDETLSGFDISPDKRKLLIPVCSKTKVPFIIEYDLLTKQADTLVFNEFINFKSMGMWLQYSHDGKSIVYNFFTPGLYRSPIYASSSAGVIDIASHTVKKIDLDPDDQTPWVSMFPRWSPKDDHIGYVTCRYDPSPPGFDFYFGGNVFVFKLH